MSFLKQSLQWLGMLMIVLFLSIMLLNFMSAPESKGLLGYKGYIILSGSMESVLTPGDFIIVKAHPYQTIKENDVVTFKVDDKIVTHRVVRLSNSGLTTKGDANEVEDSNPITKKEYIGRLKVAVPYLGRIMIFLQKPYMIALYLVLIGIFFIFGAFEKKSESIK